MRQQFSEQELDLVSGGIPVADARDKREAADRQRRLDEIRRENEEIKKEGYKKGVRLPKQG